MQNSVLSCRPAKSRGTGNGYLICSVRCGFCDEEEDVSVFHSFKKKKRKNVQNSS